MKTETNEKLKDGLLETGKNLGSGLVGMVAGSAVGRHSLWLGAITIFGGAWYKYDWVTSAGVGMVASNGFAGKQTDGSVTGMAGFKGEIDNAKNRAISSLKALGKKVYLDKLSPSMSEKLGLGTLEQNPLVFVGSQVADQGDFDTTEVDAIIRQLEEGLPVNAPETIQPSREFSGTEMNGEFGNLDIQELNGEEDMLELEGNEDMLELNTVA